MPRALNEAPITTRNARAKLAPRTEPYWRGIDPEVHLGYRRGPRGGVWLVRWRVPQGYWREQIGTADDEIAEGTLSYNEAVRAARTAVETARAEERASADGPVLLVASAVEAYIAERDARESKRRGRPVRSDAGRRLRRYVIGQPRRGKQGALPPAPLADVALHALTEADLMAWVASLPAALKATSQQRLANDLKAALNATFSKHRAKLSPTFPVVVKHGLRVSEGDEDEAVPIARDNQILTDAQVSALLMATREIDAEQGWDGDLFRLVAAMAATGARFSQIARMRVGDVQRARGRLMVPTSRKGKGKTGNSTPVPVGADILDALQPVVTGRKPAERLLERWRHKQHAGSIAWHRDSRGAWLNASELVRPWSAIRERCGMPDVIPYALRHSSIVRCIKANLPIRLVADLHDTSTAMIERHYAKWISTGLDELAARAVVPLVPSDDNNVIPLSQVAKR